MLDLSKYSNEPEFHKALKEMLSSLDDKVLSKYESLLEIIVTPDRVITFDAKWLDDNNVEHINKGYRV